MILPILSNMVGRNYRGRQRIKNLFQRKWEHAHTKLKNTRPDSINVFRLMSDHKINLQARKKMNDTCDEISILFYVIF